MRFSWMKAALAALAVVALGSGIALAQDPDPPYPSEPPEQQPPQQQPPEQQPPGDGPQQAPSGKPRLTKNKNYLSAVMSGAWELGKDGSPVQGSAARGSAQFHVIDGTTLCYGLTVNGLADGDAPAAAHIHKGKINQNGPIVIELKAPEEGNPGWGGGCTEVDPAVIKRVQKAPVNYYVNIHSGEFKDGALRGQIAWTRWFEPAR